MLTTRSLFAQAAPDSTRSAPVEEENEDEPEFEGVAEVKAPPSEMAKRVLDAEQLTTLPGTRGDAIRAVEVLPGVGRTQFGSNPGPPPLRGSPPGESAVFFDGAAVPLLYHFGGLTSVFNSHLLEDVTLYPGNFAARYGRVAGGIVEARVRDPKSDRLHLKLELSAIDSFALAEGPLGKKTALAVAARRSNVDLFVGALIDDDSTAVIAAPVYYDYQAILSHRFNEANKLRLLAYGSYDALELQVGEAAGDDPALRGQFGSRESFHRVQLELDSKPAALVEQRLMLALLKSPGRGGFGPLNFEYNSYDINGRADWTVFAAPWLRADAGFDVTMLYATFKYDGPGIPSIEGAPSRGSLAGEASIHVDSSLWVVRPAGYLQASLQPTRALSFVPSLRVDYASDVRAWTIDPRFNARFQVAERTALKAGAGSYSQPPFLGQATREFGNVKLRPFRTLQASLGAEHDVNERLRVGADVFYKRWFDNVVGTPGGAAPVFVNDGTGTAYGLEMLLNLAVSQRTRLIAAYTLSRSTRRDAPNAATRLFDRDQTHNLSLAGSLDLGRGWQAAARFRYVSGDPYSVVRGAVYDASTDTYRPLYAELYGARNPAFHQLDVRVEKTWALGPLALTAYLEVMNVYNAQNQERRRYSFDYTQSARVTGLPLFPNLGLRGEL